MGHLLLNLDTIVDLDYMYMDAQEKIGVFALLFGAGAVHRKIFSSVLLFSQFASAMCYCLVGVVFDMNNPSKRSL